MPQKIVFFFSNFLLVVLGFYLKCLSLSMSGLTMSARLQKRALEEFCAKDILHMEKVCEYRQDINLYSESYFLNLITIFLGTLVLGILIYNWKKNMYPSKLSLAFIIFSILQILFSILVFT